MDITFSRQSTIITYYSRFKATRGSEIKLFFNVSLLAPCSGKMKIIYLNNSLLSDIETMKKLSVSHETIIPFVNMKCENDKCECATEIFLCR